MLKSVLSKYNIFFEKKDKKYVYNTLTGCLIEIKENIWHDLKNNKCRTEELLKRFISLGFLVKSNEDEIELLKYSFYQSKFNNKHISYIIYPTLKCNFNCYYCFEKNERVSMSEDGWNILDSFLTSKIEEDIKQLNIRWSGGEPLLALSKIYKLSNKLINISEKRGVIYESSMATNGYLLNEPYVKILKDCNIKNITVTLDGPSFWHDKVRNIKGGKSFRKIVRNLIIASKYVDVIIRINFDDNNIPFFEELLSELTVLGLPKDKVSMYFKPIVEGSEGKRSCTLDNEIFSRKESGLIELSKVYGFKVAFHPGFHTSLRCIYYHMHSFAIDPLLRLYKCPESVGSIKYSMGSIDANGKIEINDKNSFIKASNFNPFDIIECVNCQIFPLCSGKCPILYTKNMEDKGCITEKYNIIDKLKYSIESKEQFQELKSKIF